MIRRGRAVPAMLALSVLWASVTLPGCGFPGGSGELPAVELPPPVTARARALDDYGDRLLGALAPAIGHPELPATERVVATASPKIELLFIVAGLASGWQLYTGQSQLTYPTLASEAAQHFTQFGRHPAVLALSRLRRQHGFWYDALLKLALSYSDPPALEQVYPLTEYLIGRAGGSERSLREFMAYLRDFALVSGFTEWWAEREQRYVALEETCRACAANGDPLGHLESYFGARISVLLIIPTAMITSAMGGWVEDPEGRWAVNCFGPEDSVMPSLIEGLTYHEAGHAFVNPVAGEWSGVVASYSSLFDLIAATMRRRAYNDWETALCEHVLRACHARIYLATKGEQAARQCLATEESQGFRYVRALYEKLAEYEADRARYPDFRSFFPALLTALDRYR